MWVRVGRVFESWRLGRVAMMAVVTGSTAYGFGAALRETLLIGLAAAFLALGGFYLDYLADWRVDRQSGKLLNPIAAGEMSPRAGLAFVIVGVGASAALGWLVEPWTLLPMAGVIAIVGGLAAGVLDTPVARAVSLGAIQGLYVVTGGLSAGAFGPGVILTALFLLFAMTGGRVMGDVRDLPHDTRAGTMTIPRKYGTRWASVFLLANEVLAYLVALSVYWVGSLGTGYLYCIWGIVGMGTVLNLVFVARPTPRVADRTNKMSFMLLGTLYVLGMVLGRQG